MSNGPEEQGQGAAEGDQDSNDFDYPNSFVSFVASLHPENLDPQIGEAGDPWKVFHYEVTRNYLKRVKTGSHPEPSAPPLPILHPTAPPLPAGDESVDTSPGFHRSRGNILDRVFSNIFAFAGVAVTFSIEVASVAVYVGTVVFDKISLLLLNIQDSCGVMFILLSMTQLFKHTFQFAEVLLLFTSVLAVELLACCSFLICSLFSFSWSVGHVAHQRTRRVSHVTRWACRHPFKNWTPTRASLNSGSLVDDGSSKRAPVVAAADVKGTSNNDYVVTATAVEAEEA